MKATKPEKTFSSLEEREDLYKSMLKSLPLTTFLCGRDKKIINLFNPASLSLIDYHLEEFLGRNILELLQLPDFPLHDVLLKFNEAFDKVLESGKTVQFEYEWNDEYFGAGGALLGEEHVIFHIRNITIVVRERIKAESIIRNELSMAMIAGGITSWTFDVERKVFSSGHDNEVIGKSTTYEEFLSRVSPAHRYKVPELFDRLISGGVERGEMTLLMCDRQGKEVWLNLHVMPQEYTSDGKVAVIVGSQKDVTQALYYENSRTQLIKQNELIMDNANCGFIYITPDYRVAWENTTRVLPPEFADGTYFFEAGELCYKNEGRMQNSHTRRFVEKALQEKTVQRIEKQIPSQIWVEMTATPVIAPDGTVEGVVLKIEDITERVSLRRESENLYNQMKTIVNALPVGVEIYSPEGQLQFLNDIEYGMFGLDKKTFDPGLLTIKDNPNLPGQVKEDVANGRNSYALFPYRFGVVKDSGYYKTTEESVKYIECTGRPVTGVSGRMENYVFIVRDVTQEKRINDELQQSKHKTELAMKAADIMLWEFDVRRQLFICENEPLNGYDSTRPLSGTDYVASRHPDEQEQAGEVFRRMCIGEDWSFRFESRVKLPGYEGWQYCTVNGSPYEKDADDKVVRYIGTRKNTTTFQKKKQLQETILNSIPVSIHIKDVADNFRYIFCNDESKRLFGTGEEKTTYDVLDADKVARIEKTDKEVFATGKPYFGLEHIELKDGRVYDTLVRKSVIYDNDKHLLLNVRWDQSLQNDLERRAKVLDILMEAMNAYTWFFEPGKDKISFGEGSDKIGQDVSQYNTLEKFIGFIHPDEKQLFRDSIGRLMRGETEQWNVEYRADLNQDGIYEWWQTRGMMETTVRDDIPYTYIFGMTINIDEHKQTELTLLNNREELNHLVRQNEIILNNTNSGLAYITTDYRVQWENISICSASLSHEAYKKGELCYRSARGRDVPCEDCVMRRAMLSHEMERVKFTFANGNTVEIFATPVFRGDASMDGVVIRVDDVTERERMIRELQNAKALAEQSDKLKSAFLANMSHEIRTPLNAIVGFSGLLAEPILAEEKEEYLKIIRFNNELLLKLISDILDLSKIEAGTIELKYEDFDFSAYFDDMAVSMRQRVTNPNVRLVADNPYPVCRVRLDKNRVAQIMTNYVINAIKYTAKGFIEMGYEPVDGGIRLFVRDSGIGIPDEKKNKVFYRFEKLDEFAQGTGLGLSICKAIAESMGGNVGFESQYGEGSYFWAVLPCETEIEEERGPEKESSRRKPAETRVSAGDEMLSFPHRKVILVAEDIPSNFLLVSALLRKYFDLVNARNGSEAVEAVRNRHFDLVLMDMKMPVMDGLTATAEIRKFNTDLPIIALTAHAFDSDQQAALEAGCNEYLVKPVDKTRLLAVLKRYCCKRK